jgi:hypothetical protein
MTLLVTLVWCVYLTECFVRWRPGTWIVRARLTGSPQALSQPEIQFLSGRFAFVSAPVVPWLQACLFAGDTLDASAARRRLDGLARTTRWLTLATRALFAWLMIVLPVLVLGELWVPVLLPWIVVAAVLWLAALILFFAAYRRSHGALPPLETWLAAVLSPLTLMRARFTVSLSAARDLHPVAGAAVLCDDAEFLRVARMWHYDSAALRPAIERIVRERDLAAAFAAAPAAPEAGVARFCPRCHGTYRAAAAQCVDCDGVALRALR